MIATILEGSSHFNAVNYNENKVQNGDAYLIEMKNIHGLAALPGYKPEDLRNFFVEYSARNTNIKDAQFHVAFSVKGDEMSAKEITAFAHTWLTKMGYETEGQPMVIYAHTDTGNTHIHVITSRIDPQGKKIDHNNERKRGRRVLEKMMGENVKVKLTTDVESVLNQYNYSSISQCRAIFESSGYEAYEENDSLVLKRNGEVQDRIPKDIILRHANEEDSEDKKKKAQKAAWRAKALLLKICPQCSNRDELAKEARSKFGLAIEWLGQKDAPYGYILVDHKNKQVFNGSTVVKIKNLESRFQPKEVRVALATETISKSLEANQHITTRELNYILAKASGARIRKGELTVGSATISLDPKIKETLANNDHNAWVTSFCPTNEQERRLICRMTRTEDVESITISSTPKEGQEDNIARIIAAYHVFRKDGDKEKLSKLNYRLSWEDNHYYCVDFKNGLIVDLTDKGLTSMAETIAESNKIIADGLKSKTTITTKELNGMLARYSAFIKKGELTIGSETIPLSDDIKEQLNENDHCAWASSFAPTNEKERDLICRLTGTDAIDKVAIAEEHKEYSSEILDAAAKTYRAYMIGNGDTVAKEDGLRIVWVDDTCYFVDLNNTVFIDLTKRQIDKPEYRINKTNRLITEGMKQNPRMTTRELNQILYRSTGARVKKGILYVGSNEIPLPPSMRECLKKNDKHDWVCSFKPANELERQVICSLTGIENVNDIDIAAEPKPVAKETLSFIADAYSTFNRDELKDGMGRLGIKIISAGGKWYAVDFKSSSIVDLEAHGFKTDMFTKPDSSLDKTKESQRRLNLNGVDQGGKGQKRDWEVGDGSEYGEQAQGIKM